jgi:hypothetical protein
MRIISTLVITIIFAALTGGAFMASALGWGLPGKLEQPISIRQESAGGSRHGGTFLYFGSTRRHFGGGLHGGK